LFDNSTAESNSVIPKPKSVRADDGRFVLRPSTIILADTNAQSAAKLLADTIGRSTGYPQSILNAGLIQSESNAICMSMSDSDAFGDEGYKLAITPDSVTILAGSHAGLLYGTHTLLQLLPPEILSKEPLSPREWTVPCCVIEDMPRFVWRGAMLDVVRHFMPLAFLKKLVDVLALHKLNRLHLHLTDDQGWRLEIPKYPLLTEVGAYRRATVVGPCPCGPADLGFDADSIQLDGQPHGGFYTQAEMRELVKYASERNVMIVPEIDIPGHAQAIVAAYPQFGCVDGPVEVSPLWGIHSFVINPEERTFQFLEDIFADVVDIFPSPYIHIGGDEVVKDQWRADPGTQRRMRELGIADESKLHSYFVTRMSRFLTAKGRRLVGWDEILEGNQASTDAGDYCLAADAVVMSWRGVEGGLEAARSGRDAIMAPHRTTYLNYYQSTKEDEEPLAFPRVTLLDSVYGYDPVPGELRVEEREKIMGLQGQLWTEYVPTTDNAEYMLFPRFAAIAEVAWSPIDDRDFEDFLRRLAVHEKRLDAFDVNYHRLARVATVT